MKDTYFTPVVDVELFDVVDVITKSGKGNPIETPIRESNN